MLLCKFARITNGSLLLTKVRIGVNVLQFILIWSYLILVTEPRKTKKKKEMLDELMDMTDDS